MGKLKDAVIGKLSKSKIKGINDSAEFDVMYSTGFLAIDYLNGTIIHVESKDRQFKYNSTGIVDGSTNTIIGRSGSGKSTLLTQIVGEIIRKFIKQGLPTGLYFDDIEGSLPMSRKEFLLGLTKEELDDYVDFRNKGITTENVYKRIKEIHREKINNKKDYEYDTGLYDTYGERIYKLVPTVYILDSLPMLLPENLADDEDLGGSMDASAIAKTNTMMFKKISQLCKEANIIFFTINHILDQISMGFIPEAAQISGLKQSERLPGGKAALYLANNMFRVDDNKTLKKDKDGIDGSIIKLTIIKSRTNVSKRSVPLVFNKTEGMFDKELSLFYLLKEEGRIQGAGAHSYLSGASDVKFNSKNFKSVLSSSPELQRALAEECYNVLYPYLSETKNAKVRDNSTSDIIADIFNELQELPDLT